MTGKSIQTVSFCISLLDLLHYHTPYVAYKTWRENAAKLCGSMERDGMMYMGEAHQDLGPRKKPCLALLLPQAITQAHNEGLICGTGHIASQGGQV